MNTPSNKKPQRSAHFFAREPDGSVRIRMRLSAEEATLIEEGAGSTPLLPYMHRVLVQQARYHIDRARQGRPVLLPPEQGDTN